MFPPGSTIEDLPPHLQKLFWELGNMHFEKDENGDWRFADDRGELGYHQYLIRQALKNGDNDALTAHFQSANQWIDKSLISWVDRELETVTQAALVTTRQKQQDAFRSVSPDKFDGKYTNAPQKYLANVENKLLNVTREAIETTQVAVDRKSKELKTDLVNRDREHLVGHVDESATKAMTTFTTGVLNHQQQLVTQAKQVAVQLTPPPPPNRSTSGNVKLNQTPPNRMDENTDEDDSEEFIFPEYPDGIHSDEEMRQMFIDAYMLARAQAFASIHGDADYYYEMLNRAISIYNVGHPYFLSENDLAKFRNMLASIANFGGSPPINFTLAARMMSHYLGATGNPLFIDPRYLFLEVADPTNYRDFQDVISLEIQKVLRDLEFDINSHQITLENINWQTSMEMFPGDAQYALGAINLSSTDGVLNISYFINPVTLSGYITIRQNVEMYDRYNWDAEPIFFNPQTGRVITLPHYFPGGRVSPPLLINPATNEVQAFSDEQENYNDYDIETLYHEAIEKGYLPLSNPSDEWDFAALQLPSTSITAGQELTAVPGVNFFGPPANDHTNPFYERGLQILGGDSHFSAGLFHRIESNGGAKPYYVFSNADVTQTYFVQFQDNNGIIMVDPNTLAPSVLNDLTSTVQLPSSVAGLSGRIDVVVPTTLEVFDLVEFPNYTPNHK